MAEFVLYSYFRSSASYRVRAALNLKGIEYEYRAVHLLNNGGEQHDVEYKKLNPSAVVPTLVHKGHSIGQSLAIIDYLDHVQPSPPLFSKDPLTRAKMIQVCEIVNSGIQPLHNTNLLKRLSLDFGADEAAKGKWINHFIHEGLVTMEAAMAPIAGDFSVGDQVSAADCFVIPQLVSADRFSISVEPFPTLMRVRKSCEALEAFRKAGPRMQPDTPSDLR